MRSLLPLFAFLILGCGSSDSAPTTGGGATQASVDESCAASCAAQKKCISTVDETTCVNRCKNESASIGTKVRSDYLSLMTSCYGTASCDKLGQCDDEAKASISPTAAVQKFCDDLGAKQVECKQNADKAKCLDDVKVFSDATMGEATTCLSKSCSDYTACVLTTLGLRF